MEDRFVALPVGQGDAFFLQRGAFTALVDGGRSVSAFSKLFYEVLNRKSVSALVCTHNDADHANGVRGFLESGLKCDEVWLPALWMDRLDDLLTRPGEFLVKLIEDVQQRESRPRALEGTDGRIRLDRLGDWYADEHDQEGEDTEHTSTEDDAPAFETSTLTIDTDDDGNEEPFWPGHPYGLPIAPLPLAVRFNHGGRRDRLFLQALAAAERIRAIALACALRGVPIRWFRHSRTRATRGKDSLLMPLNAVEIARVVPRRIAALQYLALSTANRLSLTFCSPPQDSYPGVVFAADSDLRSSGPIPWRPNMIVTAPHHGSEANAAAYHRFGRDVNEEFDAIWIRSDGNFKTRPGSSYLSQANRFCTRCRNAIRPQQTVRFTLSNSRWIPVATHRCSCR